MLVNLGTRVTRRGPHTTENPVRIMARRAVTALDSQYVGRGNYAGIGLALMWDLGLLSPMISTAIRLMRMGFISKSFLLHYHRTHVYNPAISSYIPRSKSPVKSS